MIIGLVLIPILAAAYLFSAVFGEHVERKEFGSRSDATNEIDFPLVNSATNIFSYAAVGGMQSLDVYLRLKVAANDITNQINLVIADSNHRYNQTLRYEKRKINESEEFPRPSVRWWDKSVHWWNPEIITNGYYIGAEGAYADHIWVDESNGILFIQQND